MNKIVQLIVLIFISNAVFAAIPVDLSKQPIAYLNTQRGDLALQELNRAVDVNQVTHVRLQQHYQGYPVWGADVVLHYKQHAMTEMNGTVYQALQQDLAGTPAYVLSQTQQQRALKQAILLYQQKTGSLAEAQEEKIQPIIFMTSDHRAHWAFRIRFASEVNGAYAIPIYILEAAHFTVYQAWDQVETLAEVSLGGFGGNMKVGKKTYGPGPQALAALTIERDAGKQLCYLKNKTVSVKDSLMRNALVRFSCKTPLPAESDLYWDGDIDAINGSYSPSNDALFAGLMVQHLYQDWYHVPVLTKASKPMLLSMCVHKKIQNAYWDGKQMTFGDGGDLFYPFVSLGIAAHEISHGFTQQHSNLVYLGQSGALNESFSDMAAMAIEFYMTAHNTWQIGAEILKIKDRALRYIDQPTKDCESAEPGQCSIDQLSDYYEGLDAHFASGIFNKAFYLMASSPGWDTKKAFDIMVQANRFYWRPLTTFKEAACDVIKAARDLQDDLRIVQNAFSLVGIETKKC